jgi:hypothetical protein
MLGWSGIWGTGSALIEYLIPVPVAGGALHVPSYACAAAVIFALPRLPVSTVRLVAVGALAVGVAALLLQVDFERFNAWLFTDYEPYGSPLRFDGNAVMLFVTTDAFWTAVAALMTGGLPAPALWLTLPITVAAVFGIRIGEYRTAGPAFTIGGARQGPSRGDTIRLVFTSAGYDADVLAAWLDEHGSFARPWHSPNSEHAAVIFTNSRQAVEWGQFDQIAGPATIGTACVYEEDMTTELHAGYFDCFAARPTVAERLALIADAESTGLGEDVDAWLARVRLCEGVEVPDAFTDIELYSVCRALRRGVDSTLERIGRRYGDASEQVEFVAAESVRAGLTAQP